MAKSAAVASPPSKKKKAYLDGISKELAYKMLDEMLLIRRFEEKCGQMYGIRKIGGFCHLYIGQEAVCVGAIANLNTKKDYVLTGYRDHGHAISCGTHPNALMAELFGKITGCSRGKGGSMHFFDAKNGMLGGNGIVGSHLPVATGAAFKIMYNGEDGVVLCFFGDGAIHQGAFHEAMNHAKIWNLPVIFICENNQYGMGTHVHRVSAVKDLWVKGAGYNIPSKMVNGMDVVEVYKEMKEYVDLARKGKGPGFIEMKTYRYKGHSMSDPAKYRTREELDQYKNVDPIERLRAEMIEQKWLTEKEFEKMDEKCKKIAEDSVTFAEESPEPAIETIYEDIYA